MYTLYTRPQTGGLVVHAALEQSGADYEIITVDKGKGDHETAQFANINPLRQVPALKLPDGTTMTESAAIAIYLADQFPTAKLAPPLNSPMRPHFLRWMVFCAANIYMSDLRYYYADRHTSDPAGVDGIKATALADMTNQFEILDTAIGTQSFLLGDAWSVADIYVAMLAYWYPDVPKLFATFANLERLCRNIKEVDCVAEANTYHHNWTFNEVG